MNVSMTVPVSSSRWSTTARQTNSVPALLSLKTITFTCPGHT